MIAAIYKKLLELVKLNAKENPFHTEQGQQTVSVVEGFWPRLLREGFHVFGYKTVTYTTASIGDQTLISSSIGRKLYLKRLSLMSTVECDIFVMIEPYNQGRRVSPTEITQPSTYYEYYRLMPNTYLHLNFDGELSLTEGQLLKIRGQSKGATDATVYINGMGIEVTDNA